MAFLDHCSGNEFTSGIVYMREQESAKTMRRRETRLKFAPGTKKKEKSKEKWRKKIAKKLL